MKGSAELYGWGAAALTALWFVVHTFVGGAEVAGPLLASDLPLAVRAPAWMTWHMVTGTLLLAALLFALAARRRDRGLMLAATAMVGVIALAGIVAAFATGAGLTGLPQGLLFVPPAILGALALARLP